MKTFAACFNEVSLPFLFSFRWKEVTNVSPHFTAANTVVANFTGFTTCPRSVSNIITIIVMISMGKQMVTSEIRK